MNTCTPSLRRTLGRIIKLLTNIARAEYSKGKWLATSVLNCYNLIQLIFEEDTIQLRKVRKTIEAMRKIWDRIRVEFVQVLFDVTKCLYNTLYVCQWFQACQTWENWHGTNTQGLYQMDQYTLDGLRSAVQGPQEPSTTGTFFMIKLSLTTIPKTKRVFRFEKFIIDALCTCINPGKK